jgi:hypothetical protein
MPRVRFTVRRLMIALVLVALVLWAEAMRRRTASFRQGAAVNAWAADTFEARLRNADAFYPREEDLRWALRRLDYHTQLRRKYERAASRPWLFVAPDPPAP